MTETSSEVICKSSHGRGHKVVMKDTAEGFDKTILERYVSAAMSLIPRVMILPVVTCY